MRKMGLFPAEKPKNTYKPKPYEQMTRPGERVQVDVKVVPRKCIADPELRLFQYTAIDELTPELLWLFIERIDIGERPGRYNRNGMQEVRIIYRDIGVVDSTMSAEDAERAEVHFIPSLEMVVQQMAAQTQVS